jgi:hypothetical protein
MNANNINDNIGVITVCYANPDELWRTLKSINQCNTKPKKIIVIDGSKSINIYNVVELYQNLNIQLVQEGDNGPYDAMNKGKSLLETPLVHYLNSGDEVGGDPYLGLVSPVIIPTLLINPQKPETAKYDSLKLVNTHYCHQGIIFPVAHADYNLNYTICSDYDCIIRTFNDLSLLPITQSGFVSFYLDGISSKKYLKRTLEVLVIHFKHFGFWPILKVIKERILKRFNHA